MDPTTLFRENYEPLCRYLLRFTGDSDAAADAAQEAFVRLIRGAPATQNARAWLFKVATNVALERSRTRSRRSRLLIAGATRAPQGDPPPATDSAVESERRRRRVQEALRTLSEKERQAVLMREEGFAQNEIAEAVGTTTGSVGTLIARALRKLARNLETEREDF